jgi:crotonobetainyl-CoA:carnitine CoA-transferase CaiB-like acyl-CoA transferase
MLLEMRDMDLSKFDASTITQEELDRQYNLVNDFLKTKTKAELYEEAVKRGIMLAPCNNTEDIMENAQLQVRGFWEKVEHPELGEIIAYPGAPVKMTRTPWKISRRAPLIGEHNQEVYIKELQLTGKDIAILKTQGVI